MTMKGVRKIKQQMIPIIDTELEDCACTESLSGTPGLLNEVNVMLVLVPTRAEPQVERGSSCAGPHPLSSLQAPAPAQAPGQTPVLPVPSPHRKRTTPPAPPGPATAPLGVRSHWPGSPPLAKTQELASSRHPTVPGSLVPVDRGGDAADWYSEMHPGALYPPWPTPSHHPAARLLSHGSGRSRGRAMMSRCRCGLLPPPVHRYMRSSSHQRGRSSRTAWRW